MKIKELENERESLMDRLKVVNSSLEKLKEERNVYKRKREDADETEENKAKEQKKGEIVELEKKKDDGEGSEGKKGNKDETPRASTSCGESSSNASSTPTKRFHDPLSCIADICYEFRHKVEKMNDFNKYHGKFFTDQIPEAEFRYQMELLFAPNPLVLSGLKTFLKNSQAVLEARRKFIEGTKLSEAVSLKYGVDSEDYLRLMKNNRGNALWTNTMENSLGRLFDNDQTLIEAAKQYFTNSQ